MYIQIVMYNYFNGKTSMNALGDRLRPFAHQIQLGDAPSSVPLDDSFRLNS